MSNMSNPRRTPAPQDGSPTGLGLKTNLVLRKGATFTSPTTPSSGQQTLVFRPPPLPRRSQTSLDDVIDAHRRRVQLTLEAIETLYVSPSQSPSQERQLPKTLVDKSFPYPDGLQKHSVAMLDQPGMERRVLRPRSHVQRPSRYHDSDSGLGTSIATYKEGKAAVEVTSKEPAVKASTVTRSLAAPTTTLPGLSSRATNKICEHILKPLLAKPELKTFHPLVIDCPRRIKEKEILCLRDLEKTLLLIAPVSALEREPCLRQDTKCPLFLKQTTKSHGLYLDFCLTTIHCVQASVEYLSDREQTRPRDLPYTEGYFIDLVDQIQLYAKQLADAKENNLTGDEMDAYVPNAFTALPCCIAANTSFSSDAIKLHGGIHINGRPAELVRINKNGKAISLATGQVVDMDEDTKGEIQIKRSASEELADEDEIMRSMARRKKNASPEELAPKKCREAGCNKEFKRPCDLTKHEKTHSRPWKCPMENCKYHEYGWPTEKEMDRHCNDKHNTAPPFYKCLFPPCVYKSKRESNCKQHMEKSHNWEYVRTKTNGGKKTASKAGTINQSPTPYMDVLPPTPISNAGSIGMATPPQHPSIEIDFPDPRAYDPMPGFNFNTPLYAQELQIDHVPMQYTPQYSPEFSLSPVDNPTPTTEAGLDQSNVMIEDDFLGWNEDDIYSANRAHVPIPILTKDFAEQYMAAFAEADTLKTYVPHLSPVGQGNAMLFTPLSMAEVDHCFADDKQMDPRGSADFCLFPTTAEGEPIYQQPLFPTEMPSVAGGYSQPNSQEMWGMDYSNTGFNHYSHPH